MTVHSFAAYLSGRKAYKNDRRVLSSKLSAGESLVTLMCRPDDEISNALGVDLNSIWSKSAEYNQACLDWKRGYEDARRQKI